MVSPQTIFTLGICRRTFACRTGSIFARKRKSLSSYAAGIFGANVSKTFSSVFSVWASFRFFRYEPGPVKALPCNMLQAARIDAATSQHRFVFRREILANHANHPHIREVARRERKKSRGAAKHVLNAPMRRFYAVKRHTAYNQNGQGLSLAFHGKVFSQQQVEPLMRSR